MKSVSKKITAFFLCALLVVTTLVAQSTPSAGINDADVKAFTKNFKTIKKELDKIGFDLDELVESPTDGIKANAKADAVLKKNGISGPKRIEKIMAIIQCFAVEYADLQIANDPEMAAMMAQMNIDPIAELRALTNVEDCKIVHKNLDALVAVLEDDSDD